jgi:hypothetical protein
MENHHLGNDSKSQPSKYRLPLLIGVVGVLLLVLGFILPVQVWNVLLMLLGLLLFWLLFFVVAFRTRLWSVGDWLPTLLAEKERGIEDNIPPPPTIER